MLYNSGQKRGMKMYLMLVLYCGFMTANTALTKLFQKKTPAGLFHLIIYNIINALFACGFFAVTAKFKVSLNAPTAIYSVVYALIICINLSAQIFAYSKTAVSVVTLVSMAGGILLPSIFGIVWFHDPLTWRLVVSSILIIVAAFLPFVGTKGEKKGFTISSLFTCLLMFVLNGASVILLKLYAVDATVCDSDSLFFYTNVAIVLVCFVALGVFVAKDKELKDEGKIMKRIVCAYTPLQSLLIVSKTALANLGSLVQVVVLAEMSAPTFSVLSSSMLLIGVSAVSAFIFREKQTKGTIFAVIFAIAAIVINP